ncbi:MAG: 7-carboxy-7-deazaguanine synthase [Patiriisocius sp.]|jgi:7-carboxy-7-deazaguanine synthase
MTTLLVNEIFETIQGEGSYTGTPSIFVRLQGCPVGCPWCDTKHTWDILAEEQVSSDVIFVKSADSPTYFSSQSEALLPLLQQQGYTAKHIVITGGEPCMFDLYELTELAHNQGFSTQIETSGTYEVLCHEDTWVTVSPKINMKAGMPILSQAMQRANEIKHPIAMQKHIDELDALLRKENLLLPNNRPLDKPQKANNNLHYPMVYLQPISQQQRATELAVKTCIERNWRLSVQLHKYIGVE